VFDGFGTIEGLANAPIYKRQLQKRYGGYIQGQYYFSNQWFLSYVYGFSKAYGVPMSRNQALFNFAAVTNGYEYLTQFDQTKMIQEHNLSLWYRPIKNFKVGLGYSYIRTDWFQITTVGSRQTSVGENHRVQAAGIFYF
jgi:hypothetical protein